MKIVEEVIQGMKVPVKLLNVTRLTNFRKDGHPSVYGKNIMGGKKVSTRKQDCSHWCLPGVPDAWNELIYATLVFQQTNSRNWLIWSFLSRSLLFVRETKVGKKRKKGHWVYPSVLYYDICSNRKSQRNTGRFPPHQVSGFVFNFTLRACLAHCSMLWIVWCGYSIVQVFIHQISTDKLTRLWRVGLNLIGFWCIRFCTKFSIVTLSSFPWCCTLPQSFLSISSITWSGMAFSSSLLYCSWLLTFTSLLLSLLFLKSVFSSSHYGNALPLVKIGINPFTVCCISLFFLVFVLLFELTIVFYLFPVFL